MQMEIIIIIWLSILTSVLIVYLLSQRQKAQYTNTISTLSLGIVIGFISNIVFPIFRPRTATPGLATRSTEPRVADSNINDIFSNILNSPAFNYTGTRPTA